MAPVPLEPPRDARHVESSKRAFASRLRLSLAPVRRLSVGAVVLVLALSLGGAGAATGPSRDLRIARTMPGIVTVAWTPPVGAVLYRLYRSDRLLATAGAGASRARFRVFVGSQRLRVVAVTARGARTPLRLRILGASAAGDAAANLAQVWVDRDGGSCSRSPQPTPYDDGQACRSLGDAHAAARPGDLVRVTAGSYGSQRLGLDKGSPAVVFAPALGTTPEFDVVTVDAGAGWIELRDLKMDSFEAGPTVTPPGGQPPAPAHDLTFRDIDSNVFLVNQAVRTSIIGGDFGPAHHRKPTIAVSNPWDAYAPTNILVEGAFFHDITMDPGGEHVECILVYSGDRVTIRNNRFRNCGGTGDVAVLYLRYPGYRPRLQNVTVTGNRFGADGDAYYNLQADTCIPGLVVRDNVAPKGNYWNVC
jgi:hypothetical protein